MSNLFQCLIAFTVKKIFLSLNRIICISIYVRCPLPCHWIALGRMWLHLLYTSSHVFIHIDKIPSESFLLQAEQSKLSQPLLLHRMFQPLNHLSGPTVDSL